MFRLGSILNMCSSQVSQVRWMDAGEIQGHMQEHTWRFQDDQVWGLTSGPQATQMQHARLSTIWTG